MRPSASVIVLAYNSAEFIAPCLASVIAQDYDDFEVIVVDNASTDATVSIVRQQFSSLGLVELPGNLGYGAGNNAGAQTARGDVLVFLNPDTIVEPGWLKALVGRMTESGRKLATSKIALIKDPGRLNTSGNQIHFLGLSYVRGWNCDRSAYSNEELVSGASGASLAITRRFFETLGGFDEALFMYHDDVDLSLRALLAGEQCLYVPRSVARHDYEVDVPPQQWAWVESHRYVVLLKTYRLRTLLILLPGLVLVDLMTLAYLTVRGRAYVTAKLASYRWLAWHWRSIWRARYRTQKVRVIEDRRLLELLVDAIPFEQVAPGWIARLVDALVHPVFSGYRRLAVFVIRW
jgi:GT2 family glycosyltransferase